MKKLLALALILFPSVCFADRLGSLRSSADVLLTTQSATTTLTSTQTWSGQNNWTTPSPSTFTYGLFTGSLTVTGSGNSTIQGTIAPSAGVAASTFTVLWTSTTLTVGQGLVVSSTNNTVIGGTSGVAVGGSGTQLQYRVDATTLGGVPNSSVFASSFTVSTMGILVNGGQTANTGFNGTGGPGVLDIYVASPYAANRTLFAVGSGAQANQFYVPNNNQPVATLGIQAGQLIVGDTSATGQRIYSSGDPNSYIDLRNGSTMTLNSGTANGAGNIRIQPAGSLVAEYSAASGVVNSSITTNSQALLPGATFSYANTVSIGGINGSIFLNAGNTTATGASNIVLGGTGKTAGANLTTGGNNTCVGGSSCQSIWNDQSITAVGTNALKVASGTTNNTSVGSGSLSSSISGNSNTALGKNALVRNITGSNNTAIGQAACDNAGFVSSTTLSGSICIGDSSYVDASQTIAIGSTHNGQLGLTDVYWNGRQNESGVAGAAITWHSQASSGTNLSGGNLNIAGGQGSGTGSGGDVLIQVAPAGASGSSLNSLVVIATFSAQSGVTVNSSFTVISHPGNNGATPYAIIAASGNPTYGVSGYSPDFFQLYNSGSGKECIGFGQAGDSIAGLQPMAICRAAGLDKLDFGFKSITGSESNPLSITTNGNFPQGSSVTVNGDLIVASGDIEGPSIKNAGISGMYISSGVYSYTNPDIITATTTITSTMSVVLASCTTRGASPNAWITLTLPSATLVPGFNTTIYNLGADSCPIRVSGNGTDLIESTGTIRLDAQTQHASLRSLGATGWGSGPGGVQYTPWSIFTTQDDVGTFTVATASDVYSCPIYVPIPVGFMGIRLGRSTNSGLVGTAITDMNGKYVVGVSSMITLTGMNNYFTGGVFQLAPGWYRAEVVIPNTTTVINGSNSVASSKAFCSKVGTSTFGSDLSSFVPTLPGTGDARAYPAFDLLISGGLQGF